MLTVDLQLLNGTLCTFSQKWGLRRRRIPVHHLLKHYIYNPIQQYVYLYILHTILYYYLKSNFTITRWEWMHSALNSCEENHLSITFHLSACDGIWSTSFQSLTMLNLWLSVFNFKTTSGGRETTQLESAFLSSLCLHLCDCQAVQS